MSKDVLARRPLDRSDYYSQCLIFAYAVFAYLSIGGIFDALIAGSDRPGWLVASTYVVPLAVFGLVLLSIGTRHTQPIDWGLSLSLHSLFPHAGFLVFGIALWILETELPPADFYVRAIPAILVVSAGQIVLRARVISLIRKAMGASVLSSFVTFTIGALLFALVYTSIAPLGFWVILLAIIAVSFIRYSGSVLSLIDLEPFAFARGDLTEVTHNWFLAIAVMAVVIYFALAVSAWLIGQATSRGTQVKHVIT